MPTLKKNLSNTWHGYRRVQVKEDIFKNLITQQLQELDLSQTRSSWTYEISAAAEIYNLLDVAAFKCSTVNIFSLFEKFKCYLKTYCDCLLSSYRY